MVGVSKLILYGSSSSNCSTLPSLMRLCAFSSIHVDCGGSRRQHTSSASENGFTSTVAAVMDDNDNRGRQSPPPLPRDPIPNRPLRAEKPVYQSQHSLARGNHVRGGGGGCGGSGSLEGGNRNRSGRQSASTSKDFLPTGGGEKQGGHDFLEKFKLGFDKGEASNNLSCKQEEKEEMNAAAAEKLPPPQDADEIFKKMKETGLIPNAVAMLDGLCKDGLVQEAMKLFGLMREKGTIPEVVIYTAVVEGFCKAQKLDDAMRIFRKMQTNGIPPNAFSYTVLIQGLCKGKRLEDALDLCVEMLEAGHSPNLATFAGLVDGFCREKGLDEARSIIGALRQKGFSFDEKLVREYLDKKGPFLQLVWEAIFGTKN